MRSAISRSSNELYWRDTLKIAFWGSITVILCIKRNSRVRKPAASHARRSQLSSFQSLAKLTRSPYDERFTLKCEVDSHLYIIARTFVTEYVEITLFDIVERRREVRYTRRSGLHCDVNHECPLPLTSHNILDVSPWTCRGARATSLDGFFVSDSPMPKILI